MSNKLEELAKQKNAIDPVLTTYELSQQEKDFVAYGDTANTEQSNHAKTMTTYLLAKQLRNSTDKIIESNEALSKSQTKYTKGMMFLTLALVFVGLAQILVPIFLKPNSLSDPTNTKINESKSEEVSTPQT